ncbi:Kinesin-like protein KIF2C [Gracilariopsis chorda]|uniref:Kinesin-like protein n=1 Tax=Gracilariopsis chorda TaxID=448386 RepID=A0A2V3J4V5_9FLOR|nr:Kinesin-like protein KIF2C [Gracilariopsis chorda]|eukprot:PXF49466.1 Kinesin-like protein KIF2C [Gracilariopsis chorda]
MPDAQVIAWLKCAGLSRFAARFSAASITPPHFLQLSSTDLDALGVDGPADRKRLTDLIADLRRASNLPPLHHHQHMHSASERRPPLEALCDRNLPSSRSATPSATHSAIPIHTPQKNALAASAAAARHALRPSSTPANALTGPRVTVCVRKRPLTRKERTAHNRDIVTVNPADGALFVHELREKVDLTKHVVTHPFTFDRVFGEQVSNSIVYENTAKPLVDTLFAGGRGTCFAYGQTGAGKTFTMAGDGTENPGLYTLAVRDVFDRIRAMEADEWQFASEQGIDDFEPSDPPQVWISFYEIYASRLQDLLNRCAKLECREDGNNQVQIVGLAERLCEVEEDVLDCIDEGSAARSTGVTGANDDSSRSHAVFQIELRQPPSTSPPLDVHNAMRERLLRGGRHNQGELQKGAEIGRLCFIDLAGSERGSDTANSTKQTRMEGAEINKSLLALKECIRAMDKRKDHTPFRGSKLTQVLKASFVGKSCKTVMIANISPASCNVEHTLNTLRYSDRVKEIKKEKSTTVPIHEGSRLGGRRATFSHGIGVRSGIPSASATPVRPTSVEDPELESKSQAREKLTLDRKSLPSQHRSLDIDALATPARGTKRAPPRRTAVKSRTRVSDGAFLRPSYGREEEQLPVKQQKPRVIKRRTPRAATMIPTRPSTGGTFLPRPPQRRKGGPDKPLVRSNSMHTRSPTKSTAPTDLDSDVAESTSDELTTNSSVRKGLHTKTTKNTHVTAMMTRRRTRELQAIEREAREREAREAEAKRKEEASLSAELSSDNSDADNIDDVQSRRKANPKSAAQSVMDYYMNQTADELSDEELLFTTSDNMVDEATAMVQERLGTISTGVARGDGTVLNAFGGRGANGVSSASDVESNLKTRTSPASSTETSPTNSPESLEQAHKSREKNINLKNVIRMHHVQIEELMRLTEVDVALVNAAEKGEIDAQEYAMKLSLNLSQKMDLVRRLQAKLVLLE